MMEHNVIPEGYKQTKVGVIPDDWDIDTIDNVLSITTGGRNTQDKIKDGLYPFYVRSQKVERINSYSFDGEGVLTAGDGVGTGKVFHYINGKCDIHQRVYLMCDFSKKLHGYYFYIFFKNNFYNKVMSMTAKSSVDSVRREMIADMFIALPPLEEQIAISKALFEMDTLIASIEKLIAKIQAIKTATMQQLLTGKKRLPPFDKYQEGPNKGQTKGTQQTELGEIPEDWNFDIIDNVLSITTGGRNTQDKIAEGKYPFYVRSQTIERINSYSFDGEGVLTAGDGVGTGKIFHYINGKCDIHQRVYLMHDFSKRLHGYYFYIYFKNYFYDKVMSMTAKSSVDSVRREMIADMPIVLPSIEEQKVISTVLTDMENELDTLNKRLVKTQQIKQGMMQELLTGKTRLPISEGNASQGGQ
jgi:type I restriction enzyme S subunit